MQIRKLGAVVLAGIMSLAMAIPASAANPTTASDTEAGYTKGYYYDANGDVASETGEEGVCDYFITVPSALEIAGSEKTDATFTGQVKIKGVTQKDVSIASATTVDVKAAEDLPTATANVSFEGVTLPANITAIQNVQKNITAAFGTGNAPIAQGRYTGPITYTVTVAE